MKVKIEYLNTAVFTRRIKEAMQNKDLTCETLAEMLDVHATTVQKWRSGNNIPTLDMTIGIADALDVSLDWLTGRKESVAV